MLDTYSDALEYDLQKELSLDLMDFWRGKITTRKLIAFMHYLPEDSALVSHLRSDNFGGKPEEHRHWTTTVNMVANVADAVIINTANRIHMNNTKKKKLDPPTLIERPGAKQSAKKSVRTMSVADIKRRHQKIGS